MASYITSQKPHNFLDFPNILSSSVCCGDRPHRRSDTSHSFLPSGSSGSLEHSWNLEKSPRKTADITSQLPSERTFRNPIKDSRPIGTIMLFSPPWRVRCKVSILLLLRRETDVPRRLLLSPIPQGAQAASTGISSPAAPI